MKYPNHIILDINNTNNVNTYNSWTSNYTSIMRNEACFANTLTSYKSLTSHKTFSNNNFLYNPKNTLAMNNVFTYTTNKNSQNTNTSSSNLLCFSDNKG